MVAPVSDYVHVSQALEDVLALTTGARRTDVVRAREAYGRVSAEDVRSPSDVPPSTISRMDGFALRSADTTRASQASPAVLKVVDDVALGEQPKAKIRPGETARVATGSFTPDGTDAVVPVEEVSVRGDILEVTRPAERGSHCFATGADVQKGSTVVRRGSRLRAQDVGLAITLGIRKIEVYQRPRVAILATGSELTDSDLEGRKTRNSHGPFFAMVAKAAGCEVIDLGIARDKREEILEKLRKGVSSADLVLTTGGTSMGPFDLVDDVVRRLKPSALYHGIKMDRGRVTGVAVVRGKPVVMMPGPIQGALNAFILFALPVIQKLSMVGDETIKARARLTRRWEARRKFSDFTKVVYLNLTEGEGGLKAEPLSAETESMSLLVRSTAVTVVPEEVRSMEAGQEVEAMLIPGISYSA
ncbi:MAG: molybdopterin molybdotransferase MoeA [Nitrososphaerota archaeon]|nr:molybdopterin molybdotransferase MoeA [Nitrososphaerota archaeon]MDG6924871.1 molybdopterin molybdotransferase MoeA [Nitrososphaerota archaeon]MDG6941218.1 molybdopterin molybdotransferase MoeA [Nitrososphaerota archaeon]MDG6958569.1 molybdopterin molybdotransferase MoeA [Nitrososphaerota archaeon]MDG6961460.1 molybdopterin molybdotransferase MoeA [Nitrososphaerota archaeon]